MNLRKPSCDHVRFRDDRHIRLGKPKGSFTPRNCDVANSVLSSTSKEIGRMPTKMPISVADPGYLRQGVPIPGFGSKTHYLARFFAENCMKMKEIEPKEGCASLASPLIRQCFLWRRFAFPIWITQCERIVKVHISITHLPSYIFCLFPLEHKMPYPNVKNIYLNFTRLIQVKTCSNRK